MSFNKKRLPVLAELVQLHVEKGDDYLNQFLNADALVGSRESLDYLDQHTSTLNNLAPIIGKISECIEELASISCVKHNEEIKMLNKVQELLTNKQ